MEIIKDHKVNVEYDIDNLKITITTEHYKRETTCLTLDSYLEEIKRMYESIKDYSKEKGAK